MPGGGHVGRDPGRRRPHDRPAPERQGAGEGHVLLAVEEAELEAGLAGRLLERRHRPPRAPSGSSAVTVTYPENRYWAWPSASSASRCSTLSFSRCWRAVTRNPPRRRSSPSAMSAVRAWATWRAARPGLTGSMTRDDGAAQRREEQRTEEVGGDVDPGPLGDPVGGVPGGVGADGVPVRFDRHGPRPRRSPGRRRRSVAAGSRPPGRRPSVRGATAARAAGPEHPSTVTSAPSSSALAGRPTSRSSTAPCRRRRRRRPDGAAPTGRCGPTRPAAPGAAG